MTPEQQFARLVAADGGRPFVTYYDEATGERTELSRRSLANWVAKTHYLLTDELGLGVGDTALIALPAHWISVPVLLGCLTAGLALDIDGPAEVAFVTPETLAQGAMAPDVYAVSPERAATGFGDHTPAGAHDYVAAVRPQPDSWPVSMPAGEDDPCVPGLSRGDVTARGARLRLAEAARVMSTRRWSAPADWLDAVFGPLAAGGSAVLVVNAADDAVLDRRAEQERVTARLS